MNEDILKEQLEDLRELHDLAEQLQVNIRSMYVIVQERLHMRDAVSELVGIETPNEFH